MSAGFYPDMYRKLELISGGLYPDIFRKLDLMSGGFYLDIFRKLELMSGGQQRRASLAVALLHQPELLILDEPTVGVDPLLRY